MPISLWLARYKIGVFARDINGTMAQPVQTYVIVESTSHCLNVEADLSIPVPCAEHNGNPYAFTLDSYRNPGDSDGFYWKLDMATLTTGTGTDCIPIGTDLSMPMDCVSHNGTQYGFTLKFYPNPYDPSGLYWVMVKSTLTVK